MIAASLSGMICGAALGLRFRVMALLPVTILAIVVATAASLFGMVSGPRACIDLAGGSLGLQLAYAAMTSLMVRVRR